MQYQEVLQFFHSAPRFKGTLTLERMQRLCHYLGDPQKQLPFVHVAGTNGKGSTASMIAVTLTAAGYKTGLFLSPFVIDFRERIQIDNALIERDRLCQVAERVQAAALRLQQEDGLSATEFELVTAAGLLAFYESGCQIVVLEVGLGGRFDATNIIPQPLCAVITKIALDHMAQLGNTLPEIAFEKCGIIKGGTLITDPRQMPEVLAVIARQAKEKGATLMVPTVPKTRPLPQGGQALLLPCGEQMTLPLLGAHQAGNYAMAAAALDALAEKGFPTTPEKRRQGLARLRMPARIERVSEDPVIYLDGAHNPDGMQVLLEALAGQRFVAIFSSMGDKDFSTTAALLSTRARKVVTCTLAMPRAATKEALGKALGHQDDALFAENISEAIALAKGLLLPGECIVVCGSFYLAAEARAYLC